MMGEMVFWSDKAAVAPAGLMHAAAVGGYDIAKVTYGPTGPGKPSSPR